MASTLRPILGVDQQFVSTVIRKFNSIRALNTVYIGLVVLYTSGTLHSLTMELGSEAVHASGWR